jgi:hypoxanthine phosphoribosyltransferase
MTLIAILAVGICAALLVGFLIVEGAGTFRDLRVGRNARRIRRVDPALFQKFAPVQVPSLREATEQLVEFAKEIEPQWIMGVNYGGHILASYVSAQIKLPPRFVGTIQSFYDDEPELIFAQQQNHISGRLLIIDDIARTGGTLERIRQFMLHRNSVDALHFSDIVIATLFVSDRVNPATMSGGPAWFHSTVLGNAHTFPWTKESSNLKATWSNRTGVTSPAIREWKEMIRDQELSRARAARYFDLAF